LSSGSCSFLRSGDFGVNPVRALFPDTLTPAPVIPVVAWITGGDETLVSFSRTLSLWL
jgi:hypothetical protein